MSGTSLDGLDVAYCRFQYNDNQWSYEISSAQTFPYSDEIISRLKSAHTLTAHQLCQLDSELAELFSAYVNKFIAKHGKPDFISSHGHTVFHQPAIKGRSRHHQPFTTQIASGSIIAALTGCMVISDFRSADVALGGQGAPLVPIGDFHLFHQYEYCLNLGGIANISFDAPVISAQKPLKVRLASDVCFANMGLNYLAGLSGKKYDNDGIMASTGKLNKPLLLKLNEQDFVQRPSPKSIGKEYFESAVKPLLDEFDIPDEDKLNTFCHHIVDQVKITTGTARLNGPTIPKLLITGGGAYNQLLVSLFQQRSDWQVVIPDPQTIEFKEALIFAFLGVLRMRKEINVLKSVTGAQRDSCSGAIYLA